MMTNEEVLSAHDIAREASRFGFHSHDHAAVAKAAELARAAVLARMATGEDAQRAAFMAGCKWEREMATTPSDAAP